MGKLATVLNCLDLAADIRLLKVNYYFYYTDSYQFLFIQKLPYSTLSIIILEEMISRDLFLKVESSLNKCLKLAYKIIKAVFFLYTTSFLYKNITSSSIIALY